jgi:hypothetical protein
VTAAVHGDDEAGGLPRGERAQRGVEVDGVALDHPGPVGDPVGVRVEAKARDAQVGGAVHARHVQEPLAAPHRHARGLGRVARDAQHPGEVIAAPAGDQRHRAASPLESAGDRTQQAVAPDRGNGLARRASPSGLVGGVLDAARGDSPVRSAQAVELGDHRRKRLERPAPARGRVDEQREAATHR